MNFELDEVANIDGKLGNSMNYHICLKYLEVLL